MYQINYEIALSVADYDGDFEKITESKELAQEEAKEFFKEMSGEPDVSDLMFEVEFLEFDSNNPSHASGYFSVTAKSPDQEKLHSFARGYEEAIGEKPSISKSSMEDCPCSYCKCDPCRCPEDSYHTLEELEKTEGGSFLGICRECDDIVEVSRPSSYDGPDICPSCRSADSIESIESMELEDGTEVYVTDEEVYDEEGNFLGKYEEYESRFKSTADAPVKKEMNDVTEDFYDSFGPRQMKPATASFGIDEDNVFEYAEALYTYLSLHHEGQGSRKYELLSQSPFDLGPMYSAEKVIKVNPHITEITEENYEDLAEEIDQFLEDREAEASMPCPNPNCDCDPCMCGPACRCEMKASGTILFNEAEKLFFDAPMEMVKYIATDQGIYEDVNWENDDQAREEVFDLVFKGLYKNGQDEEASEMIEQYLGKSVGETEAIPEEWMEYIVERAEEGHVSIMKDADRGEQGHYTLVFDGNDEFWIIDEGVPVWRSEDTHVEETVNEWNSRVEDVHTITFDYLFNQMEKAEELPKYCYPAEAGGPGYDDMHYSDPMLWQAAVSMLDEAESDEDLEVLAEVING